MYASSNYSLHPFQEFPVVVTYLYMSPRITVVVIYAYTALSVCKAPYVIILFADLGDYTEKLFRILLVP